MKTDFEKAQELFDNLSRLSDEQLMYEYQAMVIEKNIQALAEWDLQCEFEAVEDVEVC